MPESQPKRDGGMLAIDTNVIVRYLTGDDAEQSARARDLVGGNDIFVATTVLLETEWLLRSAYGHSAAQVRRALQAFAGLPRVTLEDPSLAARALDMVETGLDFADALHLARAQGSAASAFITFDQALAKRAKRLSEIDVRTL